MDEAAQTGEAPQPAAAAGGAGRTGAVGQFGARMAGGQGGGRPGDDLDPRRCDEPTDDGPLRRARRRGGEPPGDHRLPAEPRPPRGRLHRPRRALRAVAVGEGEAHGHYHSAGAGRAGRRGHSGRLSPGQGAGRAELRHRPGPPDQGDARGRGSAPSARRTASWPTTGFRSGTNASAVQPRDVRDAHRPLPPGVDLEALFAETETRKVARDFTIRFKNRYWQIPEREAAGLRPGAEVIVERRLDGELRFRLGDRYLAVESLGKTPPPAVAAKASPAKAAKPRPKPPKPGPDHPWRRDFHAGAQQAMARKEQRLRARGGQHQGDRSGAAQSRACRASPMTVTTRVGGRPAWGRNSSRPTGGPASPHHQADPPAGHPPDLQDGRARPSDRGATVAPTPSPVQAVGGGRHIPRGGHFYLALPPDISTLL